MRCPAPGEQAGGSGGDRADPAAPLPREDDDPHVSRHDDSTRLGEPSAAHGCYTLASQCKKRLSETRGGFLFNVNLVFLSQIAIYGFAFGLRVVLARGLGDTGLGTYSLFFVGILVAGGVANLGVGLGNIYFLNKATYEYRVLLSNSLAVILWTTVAGWAFVLAWAALYGRDLFISGDAYWLWGLALPAVVAYTILTSFLHGRSRFVALQTHRDSQGALAFVALAVLYAVDDLTVGTAIAAWTGVVPGRRTSPACVLIGVRQGRPCES